MSCWRALLTASLAALIAGCGASNSNSQRPAVAAYLKQVNKIESALTVPLKAVTEAGREFSQELSSGGVSSTSTLLFAAHERALLDARSGIKSLRARLAALKTPPPAAHLRALLLQLTDGQARLTGQVAKLVVFLPALARALEPLGLATRQLEVSLSRRSAPGPAAVAALYASKATALRQFKTAADSVLTQLRLLDPPAVSRPAYSGQVSALKGMSVSAAKLATALDGGPHGNVTPLLIEFDRAATSNQTVQAQRTQIAAIRAYDAGIAHLNELGQAAERERLRLANTLR